MTAAGLLIELATYRDGIEVVQVGGTAEYRVAGRAFAAAGDAAVELRLGAEVVAPALRTSETGRSERGPDWVRLAPRRLDRFAADRTEAWFDLAWRRAGGRDPEA